MYHIRYQVPDEYAEWNPYDKQPDGDMRSQAKAKNLKYLKCQNHFLNSPC